MDVRPARKILIMLMLAALVAIVAVFASAFGTSPYPAGGAVSFAVAIVAEAAWLLAIFRAQGRLPLWARTTLATAVIVGCMGLGIWSARSGS